MKNYLILKYLVAILKEYIFIFLATTILTFITFSKTLAEENIFIIPSVKTEGNISLNFSRDKYLNKCFLDSFQMLMQKILLRKDLKKINNTNLKEIKNLIGKFQILEENYHKDIYSINLKLYYDENKIKDFLGKKNISFSKPENISVVFYPILYINEQMQDFNENFFYKNWNKVEIKNESINFVLPLQDLDDISKISKMKNRLDDLDIESLVSKYDINNYVFTFMNYQDNKFKIYLKTNFNNNVIVKNISHKVKDIGDEKTLNSILTDLKLNITDLWKEENLINVLVPLSITIKFEHQNLKNLDKIRNTFYKLSVIDKYSIEKFNVNNSFFKIYYYSSPKKLRSELLKYGYILENNQGFWQIYLNE